MSPKLRGREPCDTIPVSESTPHFGKVVSYKSCLKCGPGLIIFKAMSPKAQKDAIADVGDQAE